jgi:putative inorganic carbon (HCO3(-)) transporter
MSFWKGVIKAIADFWLWGVGPGSFQAIYPWYRLKNTISAHAHQLYLQVWLENGILSLAAFTWFLKKLIIDCFAGSKLTRTLAIIIVIFLGYGLVESWSQNRLLGGYFWLFCGLLASSKGEESVAE